ncbi:MAG: hypothetical protein CO133_01035 [Candidatus Komeilibacteria bacterium CG_4_9_14_3_um_filter_37_5]|nr:MAG: hypothetical protein CO133_01035 [Candidatus Komeilibacteria bacterium CG_4_9_14_3_um_filter_37_5]
MVQKIKLDSLRLLHQVGSSAIENVAILIQNQEFFMKTLSNILPISDSSKEVIQRRRTRSII